MDYKQGKYNQITALLQKVICLGFVFIFLNFSIQFSNHITANIIEAAVADASNTIDENLNIDYGSNSTGTEEQHEETESNNNENTSSHKKTEFLSNTNVLALATATSSSKNHFVMYNVDEVSLEIPSPPPWA